MPYRIPSKTASPQKWLQTTAAQDKQFERKDKLTKEIQIWDLDIISKNLQPSERLSSSVPIDWVYNVNRGPTTTSCGTLYVNKALYK